MMRGLRTVATAGVGLRSRAGACPGCPQAGLCRTPQLDYRQRLIVEAVAGPG